MQYGNVFVSAVRDDGIERDDGRGGYDTCQGYFCQVYADEDLAIEINSFCLAVGHEIQDLSDKSLDEGIRWYLDIGCPAYSDEKTVAMAAQAAQRDKERTRKRLEGLRNGRF